jgi:hypothetical protein
MRETWCARKQHLPSPDRVVCQRRSIRQGRGALRLVGPACEIPSRRKRAARRPGKPAFNFMIAFCGPDQLEAAKRRYDELAEVASAADQRHREEFDELQTLGACRLLQEYGKAARWTEARRLYRSVGRLSRTSSQSKPRAFKARAAAFLNTHKQMALMDRFVDWAWGVWRSTPWGAGAAQRTARFGVTGGRRRRHLRSPTSDAERKSAAPD